MKVKACTWGHQINWQALHCFIYGTSKQEINRKTVTVFIFLQRSCICLGFRRFFIYVSKNSAGSPCLWSRRCPTVRSVRVCVLFVFVCVIAYFYLVHNCFNSKSVSKICHAEIGVGHIHQCSHCPVFLWSQWFASLVSLSFAFTWRCVRRACTSRRDDNGSVQQMIL